MFKLTFENGEGLHALYSADEDRLRQYVYDAELEDTAYEIVNINEIPE